MRYIASTLHAMHALIANPFRLSLISIFVSVAMCWSSDTEHTLRATLFDTSKYHRLVRPEEQTEVDIALNLITINEVDMQKQMLSMTGWLTVEWIDGRLNWTVTNGVDHIYALDSEIWKPELFIDNSISDVSILQDIHLLFKVKYTGTVDWEFPRIFNTHCDIDTTFYPYDTQKCPLEITNWAYTKEEVFLKHLKNHVNIEDLKINGEWVYISSTLETKEMTEHTSTGVDVYSQLVFYVILQRRPEFYVTNVILPILLMSFLNVLVFYLPADSGEKISYSLTVLLALAVFLTLIADSMPNTSTYTAVLSVYLTFTLCMGVLCVVFSVFVLKIHFKGTDPPPYWVQKVTRRVLVPVGCWNGCRRCQNCKQTSPNPSSTQVEPIKSSKKNGGKMISTNDKQTNSPTEEGVDSEKIASDLNYTWKDVASIVDRFLLVTSLSITMFATVVFMIALRVGSSIFANNIIH